MSKTPKWKMEYGIRHILRSKAWWLLNSKIITIDEFQKLVDKIWEQYPTQTVTEIFPDYWERS